MNKAQAGLRQIAADRKMFGMGTTVTNCIAHMSLSLTDRPDDCRLCVADIKNTLRRAITTNQFMNELLDRAESLIEDQPGSSGAK